MDPFDLKKKLLSLFKPFVNIALVFSVIVTVAFDADILSLLPVKVACFIIYLYIARASGEVVQIIYNLYSTRSLDGLQQLYKDNKTHFLVFGVAVTFLVFRYGYADLLGYEFIIVYIASLVIKYPDMSLQQLYKDNKKHFLVFGVAVAFLVFRYGYADLLGYEFIIVYIASLVIKYPDMSLQQFYKDNKKHFLVFGVAVTFLVFRYGYADLLGYEFIIVYIASLVIKYPDMSLQQLYKDNKTHFLVFGVAVTFLVFRYGYADLLGYEFIIVYIASLVIKYPDMEKQTRVVSYGTGMACSFYEGYLAHILPSDGHKFVGFEENIRVYEANETVRFPVKRLFIIITKDLYCPPDLKAFNKLNRPDLPWLEACKSLEKVVKSVAGVQNRVYRNSAYKIHRAGLPPVYIAAECATPLLTLHQVLTKQAIYKELDGINKEEVVSDFCSMLNTVLQINPESQGKCEVVYFDNTDPELNLAQVLLDRIREIEPNFEEIIRRVDEC